MGTQKHTQLTSTEADQWPFDWVKGPVNGQPTEADMWGLQAESAADSGRLIHWNSGWPHLSVSQG